MKPRLLRLLIAATMVAALPAAVPRTPALAGHDDTSRSPGPNGGRGVAGDDVNGWHEEMPDAAKAGSEHTCDLIADLDGGPPPAPAVGHNPGPPAGVDDPAHDHFVLIGFLTCDDGLVNVVAEGGNDGHVIWHGHVVELDGYGPNCAFDHGIGGGHASHHGAMAESAWSHSSNYSGGPATCATAESNGGQQGSCKLPPTGIGNTHAGNNNKVDVIIDPLGPAPATGGSPSFFKYIRVGNNVYVWGCSEAFAGPPYSPHPVLGTFARRFSGTFSLGPDPTGATYPLCLLPELLVPGTPGCDLVAGGSVKRSNAWAVNNRP